MAPLEKGKSGDWTPGTIHGNDLTVKILHSREINHSKLTSRYQGRD